ncbi:copper homeostasis protein CutC [Tabrizicola sp. BL-A-41-H6]|uniref:copper homeostasis protein CutC n=1 Tax=Tabrizicola sp. BL-A-41-H6 TaxID=3421107 RepID=UPI003D666584
MIIEVCVDTAEGLAAALEGGADRIELCSALGVGGLTPSAGFMRLAARAGVPVHALIRPRAGDFFFSEPELEVMAADIAVARECGMAGVVIGASLADGRLDAVALRRLVGEAAGLSLTLHRVFDLVPDMGEALEAAIDFRFHRVLTSGGAATAVAGIDRLVALKAQAAGRIGILPGAGITAATAAGLRVLEPIEVHGSCSVVRTGRVVGLGFGVATERVTDAGQVRALRAALEP